MFTVENYFNMREFYTNTHIAAEIKKTPAQINYALKRIGFKYNQEKKRWENWTDKSYRELANLPLFPSKKAMKEIPVLEAFERNSDGMLSAWCSYCVEFHHHGAGEGHRIAHCTNEKSPYKITGYELKKVSKL